MTLVLLALSSAWADAPIAVAAVEWSKVAEVRPGKDADPAAWVDEALLAAGHAPEGAEVELTAFVSEARCASGRGGECEVAVRWKLRERLTGAPRYTVLTRGVGEDVAAAVADATARLAARDHFQTATEHVAATVASPIILRSCTTAPQPLPAGMKAALAASVFVKTAAGTGSGVVVSPDGFVLTAAHVVAGQDRIEVRNQGRDGESATVVALDARQDVALLRIDGTAHACIPSAAAPAEVGTELYAVGSPLGEALEFSVSKGIVSGARHAGDVRFLQTDASLNPGNSGGPLVGLDGRLLAVVSWKVAAEGLEGLGFGVPVDAAMQSLSLQWGESTSVPAERKPTLATSQGGEFRDVDDGPRTGGTRESGGAAPATNKRGFLVGGAVLGTLGVAAILGTYAIYADTPTMTADEWTALQAGNTAGWVALAGGGVLMVVPVFLESPGAAVRVSF